MSDNGDRLVAALRQNPALAFEVLRELKDWKVASPWQQPEAYKKVRLSPDGATLVRIAKNKERHSMFQWEVLFSKRAGTASPPEDGDIAKEDDRLKKAFPSESEARLWADSTLAFLGYLLA